jgi:hypothetical protein
LFTTSVEGRLCAVSESTFGLRGTLTKPVTDS